MQTETVDIAKGNRISLEAYYLDGTFGIQNEQLVVCLDNPP